MRPEPGKLVGARYRLEHPLAAGGMGTVWVATHTELDVKVAVKFLADDVVADPSRRARFEREAKAAARLQGAHVVRTYDYGLEQGTPYIAMELLRGESLEERLERCSRLSSEEVATMLRQAAKGLEEAHELHIVHRDLKPANIFLARVGQEEVVKILDFGIVKDMRLTSDDGRTATGALLGTPHTMSPEQVRGAAVDYRSDLWSLGVVVFHSLTGVLPFEGHNIGDIFARIFVDPIPRASHAVPELGPAIDAFFDKAMARNPDLRFASASDMADAFDAALRGISTAVVARTGATREMRSSPPKARPGPLPVILLGAAALLTLGFGAYVVLPSKRPATIASSVTVPEVVEPTASAVVSAPAVSVSAAPSSIIPRRLPPRPTASAKSDDPFFD